MLLLASIVRFVMRGLALIVHILVFLPPTLLLISHHRKRETAAGYLQAEKHTRRWASGLLTIFGIKVQLTGIPAEAPVLIAANHISWLDIVVLISLRLIGFVGKAEINRWPLFGYMARVGGTMFHQRGSHDSAADVITVMVERLKLGQRVAIFPEGGVTPGTEIRVFHARMFRAAVDVECPVQPVMIRYMNNGERDDDISFREKENFLVNIGRLLARPGAQADVRFMALIDAKNKPRRMLADTVKEIVVSSYESNRQPDL